MYNFTRPRWKMPRLYALFCVCVCVYACLDVRVATASDSFTTTTHRNRKKDIKEMRNSLSPIDRRW